MTQRRLGIVVLLASLFALGMSAYSGLRSFEYARCQGQYNEINNERTRALTIAAEQERTAQRRADDAERALFTDPAVSKPAAERTAAERQKIEQLFRDYQAALTTLERERGEADKARAENPVPPPPSETCG